MFSLARKALVQVIMPVRAPFYVFLSAVVLRRCWSGSPPTQHRNGGHIMFNRKSSYALNKKDPNAIVYPRTVSHVSETLRGQGAERRTLPLWGLGRGHSQRTQRAFGTAMRLCASLSRGVAAPLGCVIFSVSVEIAACMPCAQGLSVCARRRVVSLPSARFTCC